MFLFTTVVFEESLEKRPLVRHVEEEKEEDAKTQRIILYVCVYIYAFNLKFTASKGLLNAEQKREFRIRIK